ncbi:MAG: peptidyl-prolyl cis-trans isomerase [Desulfovibrio sp.]|nr:peptidyl-prolyl cis-trans isomerase [Desulfovibrio sp.]
MSAVRIKIFAVCLVCLLCGTVRAAENTVNKIAAVVNGEMISLHELRMHTAAELARRGLAPDSPEGRELQRMILETLTNDILLRQEAKRYKLSVSNAEVEEEYKRSVQRSGMPLAQFEENLKKQKTDVVTYKERISNALLRQRIATFMVIRKVFVTPDEVAAYYEKHKDEFGGERTADFSVLMIPDGKNYQEIYQKVKSGGMNFEDAARQYSTDPSAGNGGRVRGVPFDRLPPEMKKLLSGLKDGQMSPLLRTRGGVVVIRRDSINEPKPLTFEEARPRIEEMLRAPLLEERFKEYIGQLRGKAVIDIRI